jgi:hypothetical protein
VKQNKQMGEQAARTHERQLAELLASVTWQMMATLTTPQRMSQTWWDSAIPNWLSEARYAHRSTIAWLRSFEHLPRLHAHLLLASAAPLNAASLSKMWLSNIGTSSASHALLEPFQARRGGLLYCIKFLGRERDQVDWS